MRLPVRLRVTGRFPIMGVDPATSPDGLTAPSGVAVDFVVADHELMARIGQGSYGEVWLARNIFGNCGRLRWSIAGASG